MLIAHIEQNGLLYHRLCICFHFITGLGEAPGSGTALPHLCFMQVRFIKSAMFLTKIDTFCSYQFEGAVQVRIQSYVRHWWEPMFCSYYDQTVFFAER